MRKPPDREDQERLIDRSDNVIRLVNDAGQSRLVVLIQGDDAPVSPEQRELEEADIATDLVRRVRAGDAGAETALVQRYGDRLRHVLQRQMTQYPHDVDDIVQEALTTAILRLRDEGIDDPARLGGFIYGVARNLRLARFREHSRHDGDVDPEVIARIADDQVSPDGIAADGETSRVVRQLLAELGTNRGRERDREVLLRLYLDQQSREEVCEALDIEPDHLRRVVHRAKQRLKALLIESIDRGALGQLSDE